MSLKLRNRKLLFVSYLSALIVAFMVGLLDSDSSQIWNLTHNTTPNGTDRYVGQTGVNVKSKYITEAELLARSGWTDEGSAIHTTTATDLVGIGNTPDSLLTVSAFSGTIPTPTAGTVIHAVADGVNRFMLDSAAAQGSFECRRADNTMSGPTAVASDQVLCQFAAFGRGATAYTTTSRVSISMQTEEGWTDSAQGTRFRFVTTPKGSTTSATRFVIDAAGHLVVPVSLAPNNPTVSCTGTGTGGTATILGVDTAFTVTMSTGSSPANTGTCTVTFQGGVGYATNKPPLVCMAVDGASAWGAVPSIRESTESLTAPVFTWANSSGSALVALTGSTTYKFSCHAFGV